jgi:hypothetical protein
MVKRRKNMKTSSTENRAKAEYRFPSFVTCGGFLPETVTIQPDPDVADFPSIFSGTLGTERLAGKAWRVPPHIAFANLRVEDPQSVAAFIKQHGVLLYADRHEKDSLHDAGFRKAFRERAEDLAAYQGFLQLAWDGEHSSFDLMEDQIEAGIVTRVHVRDGVVSLETPALWTFICFLFLRDFTAGKLGICANPDCPARYFKKKRSTQKFCEAGPCVAYAQRQYALRWWNVEGKARRQKRTRNQTSTGKNTKSQPRAVRTGKRKKVTADDTGFR